MDMCTKTDVVFKGTALITSVQISASHKRDSGLDFHGPLVYKEHQPVGKEKLSIQRGTFFDIFNDFNLYCLIENICSIYHYYIPNKGSASVGPIVASFLPTERQSHSISDQVQR